MMWLLRLGSLGALLVLLITTACGAPSAPAPSASASSSPKAASSASPATSPAAPAASGHDKWKQDYDAWEKETLAAAKKEGKVNLYLFTVSPETQSVIDAFKAKYGIQVETIPLRGAEAQARINQEQAMKQYVADVYETGSPTTREMADKGLIEKFVPPAALEPGVEWVLDPRLDKDDILTFYKMTTRIPVINTKMVPPDKEPKSYKDLEDPFWKGKILLSDPRAGGVGAGWFSDVYPLYGEDHVKKVISNSTLATSSQEDTRATVRGEYGIFLLTTPSYVKEFMDMKPRPFKLLEFSEGVSITLLANGVIKNAPHPNAAKLWINYRISKEGEQAKQKIFGENPIRKDVKPLDAEVSALSKLFPGHPRAKQWELKEYVQLSALAEPIVKALGK